MGKINLTELKNTSPFRKIAMGTWKTAKDPSVYGFLEIDTKKALELLPEYSKSQDIKVTPIHMVGKAVAYCMDRRPEINGMLRGSKIYLRDNVTLFYQVNVPGEGADKIKKATLAGCTVSHAETLGTAGIAKSIASKIGRIKTNKDDDTKKNMAIFKWLPWWLCKHYLNLASFLIYGMNMDFLSKLLGLPHDPFGSVMITNVGGLGIDVAYAPLCPYTRVPMLLTLGAINDKPWVVDGEIVVRPVMPVTVTFDHRFMDGIHASQMAADFKKCFAEPEKYLFES